MNEAYLPTHEWARSEGPMVVIGLSPFAAGEIGEIIHVELPKVGAKLVRGQACAELESVKSVNDYYSPVDGDVIEINSRLAESPELVNQDPLGNGWFARIRSSSPKPLAGLLSAQDYATRTNGAH